MIQALWSFYHCHANWRPNQYSRKGTFHRLHQKRVKILERLEMELFYGSFKHQRGFIASCAQCSPVSTSIHTHNCSTSWLLRLWRWRQWLMSPLLSLTPIRLKIPILAKYTAKHWSLSGASKIIFGTEIQADPTFHSLLTRKLQTPFKLNVDFRYHSRDCFYLYKYSTNINMSCILAKGVADVSLKWYKTDKCNINYGTHLHAHIGRTHRAFIC